MDNPFPPIPSSSLSRDDLIAYLVDVQSRGWSVYSDNSSFVIILNDFERLQISPIEQGYRIAHESTIGRPNVGSSAYNLIQLEAALNPYVGTQRPTRTRTVEKEPASNFIRIANLIGSSRVEAVYDPYLNDKGLANLLILVRLGNSVTPDLRLITSKEGAKKLSKSFASAFFTELGCTSGEIRLTSSVKPHRRFMLLSGGQSLIIGMSLNDLNKNEAVHPESDALDRPWFDAEWASGTTI